ncbi:unnamed protein product [Rodentolepis nana]|uniref:Serine/threonine-protein kinase TOR n=1 Tax=Rodentolepis nana TaxID=102285 RepID=A0A0R3T778_RODNA|nr:unnamed protein product [Rodentolepis nana]
MGFSDSASNRSGNGALGYSFDIMTDGSEASLSAALMASQWSAHSAAQAVQAVAAATTRGAGTQLARALVNAGKTPNMPNSAQTTAVCARAVIAANQAAHAATVAARVISNAIGNLGKNMLTVYDDGFSATHSSAFKNMSRLDGCDLDLLVGDPDEILPGTNQEFISAAASLTTIDYSTDILTKNTISGTLESLRPGEITSLLSTVDSLKTGGTYGRRIVENANSIWREPKGFVVALFSALSHISSVCPHAVIHLMDDLIPILTYMLQDPTCHAKRSIVRLLGLIGAVDPFKLKISTGIHDYIQETDTAVSQHDIVESRDVDITQSELLVNICWENREEFFAGYSLSALINILQETRMRANWDQVVQVIANVLESFNQRSIPCLHQVMSELFKCLQGLHENKLQEAITYHMGTIVQIIGPFAKEFVNEIVDTITTYWNYSSSPIVLNNCIRLAIVTARAIKTDFRPSIPRLIPCILRSLKQDMIDENLIAVCNLISDLGSLLDGHLHIIMPSLMSLVSNLDEAAYEHLLQTAAEVGATKLAQTVPSATVSSSMPVAAPPGSIPVSQPAGSVMQALSSSCSPESVEVMSAASPNFLDENFMMGTPVDAIFGDQSNTTMNSTFRSLQRAAIGPIIPGSLQTRLAALHCIAQITEVLCVETLAINIVQPLCRLLNALNERSMNAVEAKSKLPNPSVALKALYSPSMDVIANLALQMGSGFKFILPVVEVTLKLVNTPHFKYEQALEKVGKVLSSVDAPYFASLNLQRAWQSSRLGNPEDWHLWLKTLSIALLRESPSPAIRACSRLTAIAPQISRLLFNASFMSCWKELRDAEQDDLINTLESVLRLPSAAAQSREISQVILNLEEFMAHADKFSTKSPRVHLPLSLNLLAERAMKNRAFAKALRYKELEFLDEVDKRSEPSPAILASLLAIYDKLQLSEASNGVLLYATKDSRTRLTDEELWYEKLHNWDRAIALCDRKLEDERIRDKTKPILCRLRCLHALGDWKQLDTMAWERWNNLSEGARQQVAPIAASAAITLGSWSRAAHYTSAFSPADHEGGFYRALLALHDGNYAAALDEVAKARSILSANLIPLTTEGYQRTYPDLVDAQLLSEVEEVIQYKLIPERRAVLQDAWHQRLMGCQSVVEDWGRIVQLRRLVLDPKENMKSCLRYAGLCRRSGRLSLSFQIINRMLPSDPSTTDWNQIIESPDPAIVFSYTKLLWSLNMRQEAVTRLQVLRDKVIEPLLRSNINKLEEASQEMVQQSLLKSEMVSSLTKNIEDLKRLMSKCCRRLGNWYTDLHIRSSAADGRVLSQTSSVDSTLLKKLNVAGETLQNDDFHGPTLKVGLSDPGIATGFTDDKTVSMHNFVIHCYRTATEHAPGCRAAWQAWAMANYDL